MKNRGKGEKITLSAFVFLHFLKIMISEKVCLFAFFATEPGLILCKKNPKKGENRGEMGNGEWRKLGKYEQDLI